MARGVAKILFGVFSVRSYTRRTEMQKPEEV